LVEPRTRRHIVSDDQAVLTDTALHDQEQGNLIMKRILCLSVFAALTLAGNAPSPPTSAPNRRDWPPAISGHRLQGRDNIAGSAPMLSRQSPRTQGPAESKYMGPGRAQAAARDGKADMIFGIYFNDERHLSQLRAACLHVRQVVVFVAKDKPFAYKDENDLIGKKGVTNQGESYGNDFDAFIKEKLTVARANGIDAAFKELLAGNATI